MKVDKAQLLEMFLRMPNDVQEMGCAQMTEVLGGYKVHQQWPNISLRIEL